MKKIIFLVLIFQLSCNSQEECPEGINLLPMYGEVKKCKQQIEFDKEFILESEKLYGNRKKATDTLIAQGWYFFNKKEDSTSMKRFNQAWLLNNSHPEIYWAFGNLLGKQNKFKESIKFFQKSIEIDPKNPLVYESLSVSYGQLFLKTNDLKYLNLRIENLKKSIKIEPKNARILGELANSYFYFKQKDSLIKYIKRTDEIDASFVNPEVRKSIKKNNK